MAVLRTRLQFVQPPPHPAGLDGLSRGEYEGLLSTRQSHVPPPLPRAAPVDPHGGETR